MSSHQIEVMTWNELESPDQKAKALLRLREIFFLTSSQKTFSTDQAREDFFSRWAGQYLNESPEQVYLARRISLKAKSSVPWQAYALSSQKSELSSEVFAHLFAEYPVHLHINCHPKAQGLGLGRTLIERLSSDLRERGISGVHAITSLNANNVGFYKRLGFSLQKHSSLAFMALKLKP